MPNEPAFDFAFLRLQKTYQWNYVLCSGKLRVFNGCDLKANEKLCGLHNFEMKKLSWHFSSDFIFFPYRQSFRICSETIFIWRRILLLFLNFSLSLVKIRFRRHNSSHFWHFDDQQKVRKVFLNIVRLGEKKNHAISSIFPHVS
jgi:hypothetical protein